MIKKLMAVSLMAISYAGVVSVKAQANQDIISDDGREILLKENGTWEYKSNDRFATSEDGRRVRLKADGSWEYTGEKIQAPGIVDINQQFVEEKAVAVNIEQLTIETLREKKSASKKNPRKQTFTIFSMNLALAESATQAVSVELPKQQFTVQDSDGREYPILSVNPASAELKPGQEVALEVRADGSPHWWTTKSMSVILDKTVFATDKPLTLSRSMDLARKINIEAD